MIVNCTGVSVTFPPGPAGVRALENVTFRTSEREFLSIVGPSGCGKTTLLRAIARLVVPESGRVEYLGNGESGPVLLVFQERNLFPWMTVLENAAFGLRMKGVARKEREEKARDWLASLGLADRERAYPSQLSLGMKQRVAIIRAFLSNPSLLLLDEPFAALDFQARARLQQELLSIWEAEQKAVVFVTHDIDEALLLSDRVLVLNGQPGTVVADCPVTFPRPRATELVLESCFLELKREIASLLLRK